MARQTCTGAGPARCDPERRREPRGARRRDQRPERLPGPGRRYGHEHGRDRPGRARGGGAGRTRGSGRAGRGGRRPRRPDGRPGQLGRDHEPDPARDRRGPRRQAAVQRARPGERPRPRDEDRLWRGRQARRGHDPDGHPRVVGGGRARGRAGRCDGDRSSPRRSRRPRSPSPERRRCCRSCARPAWWTRADRASCGCSRAPSQRSRHADRGAVGDRSPAAARRGSAGGRPRIPLGLGGARGRRVRLRDGVHPDRRGGRAARRPGDPGAARGARQLGPRRRRRADGQGPRPQRAARRDPRLRAVARGPDPDHGREPRHDGGRRPGGQGDRVRRREPTRATRPDRRPRPHRRDRDAAASVAVAAADACGERPRARRPGGAPRRTARAARTRSSSTRSSDRRSSPSSPARGSRRCSSTTASSTSSAAARRRTRARASCSRIARLARSREVVILPNNPNVRLAAEQAASICDDRRLVVVPTRNAAEGVAALLAYKPDARRGRQRRSR